MRNILFALVSLMLATAAPSMASHENPVEGCTASVAVAATPIYVVTSVGTYVAAPECSFWLNCPRVCLYDSTLDVNGSGIVLGRMTVARTGTSPPASSKSCSGIFHCDFTSQTNSPTAGRFTVIGLMHVQCAGGGIAAMESVSCSTTLLAEF